MKLSIWLYSHRFGDDVLCVLAPDGHAVTKDEVIALTGIEWEGDEREDESLGLEQELPVDVAALTDPNGPWKLPVAGGVAGAGEPPEEWRATEGREAAAPVSGGA